MQTNPAQGAAPPEHAQHVFVAPSPSVAAFPIAVPTTSAGTTTMPAISGGAMDMQPWGMETFAGPSVPVTTTPSEMAAAAAQEAAAAVREVSTTMISGDT
jgi:hypothetical protein